VLSRVRKFRSSSSAGGNPSAVKQFRERIEPKRKEKNAPEEAASLKFIGITKWVFASSSTVLDFPMPED